VTEILPQPAQLPEKVPLDFEPVRGWIEVEVRDDRGRVVQRGRHKMHSFLNNFLSILLGAINAGNRSNISASVTNPGGGTSKVYAEFYNTSATYGGGTSMALRARANEDFYGIVVGSGSTPVTLTNFNLASKISHGTGAGQLSYDEVVFEDLGLDASVTPPVYRFRFIRTLKNLSGGGVTINEVGLIAWNFWRDFNAVNADVKFLIARDVLPTTYTVPDGGSATVAVTVEVVLG